MSTPEAGLEDRVAAVRERAARAAERAVRDPETVKLVAVTKKFSAETVDRAIAAGLSDIGENRVQEALDKRPHIHPALPVTWHLIGHLQRNKAARAVELFDLIHTVDSKRLGRTLGKLGEERGREVDVLVQVNVAAEPQKSGVSPEELPELIDELATVAGLHVRGLMCIPPAVETAEAARPHFANLRRLASDIESRRLDRVAMSELSMGMSNDFEVAIEEGATLVRVGSAIFGPRPT